MDNKCVKSDNLLNDRLELFKNLIAPLNKNFIIDNIKSLGSVKFSFPIESIIDDQFEINNKYIEYTYANDDLNFINDLVWIYLESNEIFKKQIKIFENLCKNYEKNNNSINPLYSIEYDSDFEKFIIEKVNKNSKNIDINSFEEYRDLFYDKFGIDIVDYYNICINTHPTLDEIGETYKYNILKSIDSTFYPYKSRKIHSNSITKQPIHRFIKRYTTYIELSPFVNILSTKKIAKEYLDTMKAHIKELDCTFKIYYENVEDEKKSISNAFNKVSTSEERFKKAFMVFEIIRYYKLEDQIDKAFRLFNFYLLKKFNNLIFIAQENLADMLEFKDEYINIEGAITLSSEAPITPIQDGKTKENIRKIVKVLLYELP